MSPPKNKNTSIMRITIAAISMLFSTIAMGEESSQALQQTLAQAESVESERERLEKRIEALEYEKAQLEDARSAHEAATRAISEEQQRLEKRIEELEAAQRSQEDATRAIIQDSVSTLGSKINEYVTFGGALEVLAGWTKDFSGQRENVIELNTAELDFEVQATDWALGSLIIEYDSGSDVQFPTNQGSSASVDRFTVNTATITIGNTQKFPPFAVAGRFVLPFGISTGDPVADVLSIEDPLTIQVFETREDAIGFGVAFPTPKPTPATPPVSPPQVKPVAIAPLVESAARELGYDPPPRKRPPPAPVFLSPPPPPFNLGVYFYNGDTFEGTEGSWDPGEHVGATAGFRTKGSCGRTYSEIQSEAEGNWLAFPCPWSVDLDIDYNSSVFDSNFLQNEYQPFLGQIGFVPGMAASVKANLGAFAIVAEWNGAISDAKFVDDTGTPINIRPTAWQISVAYQFDWNPWVTRVGEQGTFVAFGYSESRDLAGATQVISGEPTRVGTVPKQRYILTAGEWVLDNVLLTVEYSHIVDYSKAEGGTGGTGNGIFTQLTFVW